MGKLVKIQSTLLLALLVLVLALSSCSQTAASLPMPPEMLEETSQTIPETGPEIDEVQKQLDSLQQKNTLLEQERTELEGLISQINNTEEADKTLVETYTLRLEENRRAQDETTAAIQRYTRILNSLENKGHASMPQEFPEADSAPAGQGDVASLGDEATNP